MGTIVRNVRLFYTSGSSDKEYQVVMEETAPDAYVVYGLNGRRGAARARQPKTAAAVSLASANAVFETVFDEKRSKGYTTDPSGRPHAGATLPARPTPSAQATNPAIHFEWTRLPVPSGPGQAQLESLLTDSAHLLQWVPHPDVPAALHALQVDKAGAAPRVLGTPAAGFSLTPACAAELGQVFSRMTVFGVMDDSRFAVFDLVPASGTKSALTASQRLRLAEALLREGAAEHVFTMPWAAQDDKLQLFALMDAAPDTGVWLLRPDSAEPGGKVTVVAPASS
jgi:hypothetical protein